MNALRSLKFAVIPFAAAALAIAAAPAKASAQVTFGIGIGGPAPICPYGYYGYAPYNCAPYGYYGPEWFPGGAFLGAGPWYHGRRGWYGAVNRGYDPRFGYRGGFPEHGPYREPGDHWGGFRGNDFHNFHGTSRGGFGGGYHGGGAYRGGGGFHGGGGGFHGGGGHGGHR